MNTGRMLRRPDSISGIDVLPVFRYAGTSGCALVPSITLQARALRGRPDPYGSGKRKTGKVLKALAGLQGLSCDCEGDTVEHAPAGWSRPYGGSSLTGIRTGCSVHDSGRVGNMFTIYAVHGAGPSRVCRKGSLSASHRVIS